MIKDAFLKFWPSGIVFAVIMYATLSSDPIGADELPLIPHIDKLIHAIMMGGFAGAIIFDLQRSDRATILPRKRIIAIAVSIMIFSIFDEIAQAALTENRAAEVYDLLADWLGVWVAFFTAPPAVRKVLKIHI